LSRENNTGMKPMSIITFLVTALILMSAVKFVMVLAFRQNKYFAKKLVKSFFFYDGKKIVNAEELRLKKYYKSHYYLSQFASAPLSSLKKYFFLMSKL
jgi:hypothetical protein